MDIFLIRLAISLVGTGTDFHGFDIITTGRNISKHKRLWKSHRCPAWHDLKFRWLPEKNLLICIMVKHFNQHSLHQNYPSLQQKKQHPTLLTLRYHAVSHNFSFKIWSCTRTSFGIRKKTKGKTGVLFRKHGIRRWNITGGTKYTCIYVFPQKIPM